MKMIGEKQAPWSKKVAIIKVGRELTDIPKMISRMTLNYPPLFCESLFSLPYGTYISFELRTLLLLIYDDSFVSCTRYAL